MADIVYKHRPPNGWGWLFSSDRDVGFLAFKLGRQFPVPVDGYTNWEEQERMRRRSVIKFKGSPPLRIRFDVLLTGATSHERHETSVEPDMRTLEKMAGLVHDGYEPEPIDWAANGQHDYMDAPTLEWRIDKLEWSDSQNDNHWNDDGAHTQAYATVTMVTFTEVSFVRVNPVSNAKAKKKTTAKNNSGGKSSSKHNYTVQPGDTLSKIAARELGSASRYPEIAKLNNLRDPGAINPGQQVKMP